MARGTGILGRRCTRAAAAAALAVSLWLSGCSNLPPSAPDSSPGQPAGTDGSPAAAPGAQVPAPQPQEPPEAGGATGSAATGPATTGPGPSPLHAATGSEALADGGQAGSAQPGQGQPGQAGAAATSGTPAGTGQARTAGAAPGASPSPALRGGQTAPGRATVTAYFVLLNDGGSNGVKFGCNDSLVGVDQPAPANPDPLPAAMNALLTAGSGPDLPASDASPGLIAYNALAGSRVKLLSGSFDGTTVTVYLSGALSPGGICDVPRLEAQLTQTALAAVGAVRAQIYLNGRPLDEVLRPGSATGQ